MHPTLRNQYYRHVDRNLIAEIHFNIVVSHHSLILSTSEGVEILSIERPYDSRNILPLVVNGASDWLRPFDCCNRQLCRWDHKTFTHENVGAHRMIHCHQT